MPRRSCKAPTRSGGCGRASGGVGRPLETRDRIHWIGRLQAIKSRHPDTPCATIADDREEPSGDPRIELRRPAFEALIAGIHDWLDHPAIVFL